MVDFDLNSYVPTEEEQRISEEMVAQARREAQALDKEKLWEENSDPQMRNRERAYRANTMKSLNKSFRDYESFSIEEAAQRTGIKLERMEYYLKKESKIRGSQIVDGGDGNFMIKNPFR